MKKTLHRNWQIVLFSMIIISLLLAACGGGTKPQTYTVGIIVTAPVHTPLVDGFKAGMAEAGYVEGENINYIYNGIIESDAQVIDAEIENLLAQKVDLLFMAGDLPTLRAKEAVDGTDMPVIAGAVVNPVEQGMVESISHPGGNVTGIRVGLEAPKALEWLVKIVPGARKIYVPYNPDDGASIGTLASLGETPSQLGVELVHGQVHSFEEALAAIESLPEDIDAIFFIPSPLLAATTEDLSQAAIQVGIPTGASYPIAPSVLITNASNNVEVGRQSARQADQIFNGTKPGDIPIETAEEYSTLNYQTAQTIGLEIPDTILRQADTIVR